MTALILICCLGVLPVRAIAESPDLSQHAVALWNFDEGSGTTLKDISGNGHHGNIVGATWVKGSWGSALRFDRDKRNYVKIPDSLALHVQPPYTLGVWFRTTSSKNNAVYLVKSGGTFTGCGLYFYGDSMAMYVDAKGVDQQLYHKGNGSKSLPDGTWHHVMGTCGNGKMTLFLDGQVFAKRDVPQDLKLDYSGTQGAYLGCWFGSGHFDGTMGKAYVLRMALTTDEVKAVFEAERKQFNNNVTIHKASRAPMIDGRLDDACWQNQAPLDRFTRNDYESTPAKKQTKAYLSYDDKNLYVAARCEEPKMATIIADQRPRDDERAGDDDCIEVFVAPQAGRYHHFVLTAANALLDRKCDYEIERTGYAPGGFFSFTADRSWNCRGIKTATYKGEKYWSVEMAIPLSQIGGRTANGARWRLNIARSEKQHRKLSTFTPLFESLHQPEAFSLLTFSRDTAVLAKTAKKFVSVDVTPRAKTNDTADKGDEPVIFVSNYLDRGTYTTLPVDRDSTDTIEMFASRGEYEPATFSIRATGKELQAVKVTVGGDLTSDSGDVIPAKNVEIRVVELWRRQISTRQHMYMERFLERHTTQDVPRHTTRRFWLTVHVPEKAQGGSYRSRILIAAGGEMLKSLNLRVEVLPFRLRQGEGMGYFMYLPTWGIPPKLRTEAYLKKIFVDMQQHGMTTATLYPYGLPFGRVMDVLRDTRLLAPGIPVIWLGADAVGPETWKKVLDEAKKKNWPELALYLQDEPGNQERIKNAKRLFAVLDQFRKQHPEHRKVRTTTAIGSTGIEALGEQYDIWIAGAGFNEELVKKSKEMNKLLWTYDCNLAPVDAESSRYYFGLWCWKTGIKGSALWAYSDPGSTRSDAWDDVFKDVQNVELHYSFVRPTPVDLVPTIGWEAVREGVDDHRYITTLSHLIRRAEAAGLKADSKRAQRVLKELADKIDVNGYLAGIQSGHASKRRLGTHYDRTSPQGNIAKGDYNRFRHKIADEILRLQRALKD
jgi:hypothetical protein